MGVKLSYNPETGEIDPTVDEANQQFDTGDDIETDILISLFSDARATAEEMKAAGYPEGTDPRGYWLDTYPEVHGDNHGSKLWLLARALKSDETLALGKAYCEEALAHLVQDGAARSIVIATSWLNNSQVMRIAGQVYEPSGNVRKFSYLWDAIKGTAESE